MAKLRSGSVVVLGVFSSLFLVTLGSSQQGSVFDAPSAQPTSLLLWESAAIDDPGHARHSAVLLGAEDVTGDGISDIVAAIAEHVHIYAGDGLGAFTLMQDIALTDRVPLAANPFPHFAASAGTIEDLDGDGAVEIIVGGKLFESPVSERGVLFVLASDGGQYAVVGEYTCSGTPRQVTVRADEGDVTQLWLANTVETGEEIQRLLLQDSAITDDRTLLTLDPRWYVAAFVDINEDGFTDAVLTHIEHGVEIRYGDEADALGAPVQVTDASGISSVALADMDGDGQRELVGCGKVGIAVISRPWPADQSRITVYDLGMPVRDIQIDDLNGDLTPDVVAIADRGQRILFLPGDGEGRLGSPQTFIPTQPAGWTGNPLIARDLNGDEAPDILLETIHGIRAMINGTSEPWGSCQIPFGGDKLLTVGDVDQDGDIDIVTQGRDGVDVLWNRDGALALESDYVSLDGRWCTAAVVTDGRIYALSRYSEDSRLPDAIWLSIFDTDLSLLAEHRLGESVLPVLACGDLDRDGEMDVFGTRGEHLWVAWGGDDLADYDVGDNPSLVAAIDDEHDGQDVLVVATGEYADIIRVSFLERQATASEPLLQLLSVPFAMTSTDWDQDGKLDALFVATKFAVTLEEGATTSTVAIDGAEWGYVTATGDVGIHPLDGFPEKETINPFVPPSLCKLDEDGDINLAYTTTSSTGIPIHPLVDGVFEPPTAVIDKGIGPLLAADLDGNGIDELIGSTLGMFPVVWIQWNGGAR